MIMNRTVTTCAACTFCVLLTRAATAQTVVLGTIGPTNVNNAGMMFDITGKESGGIFVRKIETLSINGLGQVGQFQVYTRTGTYVGNENSSSGWSLVSETFHSPTSGQQYLDLEVPEVTLDLDETMGVYICVINYIHQGNPIQIPGVALMTIPPALPTYENDLARIDGGTRKLAAHLANGDPFATQSDPNFQWAGRITFAPVPEPSSCVAVAAGMLMFILRRRTGGGR